jgi:predicted dehydrogenase
MKSVFSSSPIRIGVVGCGYWGQHLVRNFSEVSGVEVRAVCDFNLNSLAAVKRRYPKVELKPNFRELISDTRIDAIVIATPMATHFPFARTALLGGKHVLVEKPMCTSSVEALELIELAEKRNRVLMVDHTFLYSSAVSHARSLIEAGDLGSLFYFDSIRISLGLGQSDMNVLWDLGSHDFSILDHLAGADPTSVSAIGACHLGSAFENIACVSAYFPDRVIARFHLNWLGPTKIRQILIGGSKKTIVYDDLETNEKIKIYSKKNSASHSREPRENLLTGYQSGDMFAPHLEPIEALRGVANDFASAITDRRCPLSDGHSGYRVVRLLEAAQTSMNQNGRLVELTASPLARLASQLYQRDSVPVN